MEKIIIEARNYEFPITEKESNSNNNPKSWKWWFKSTGYTGDYSFIYFQ
tara:strand:- start:80 stop:226 length:147 start_codon:yes stop_codon:yes gene_type:complete